MVAAAVEAHPKSYDEREELAPGITLVYPKDGESLRENYDELTAYQFVTAAEAIGLNPSIGKGGAYGRLLMYMGHQSLEEMAYATSPKKTRQHKKQSLAPHRVHIKTHQPRYYPRDRLATIIHGDNSRR